MKNNIEQYLSPLENFASCGPEENLGSALAMIQSSHDAVFVFDENKNFLGLIAPYYALFKKRCPHTCKVKTIIINPPKITNPFPLFEIADFMVATRIYNLPVFGENNEIKGVITAKNLIRELTEKRDVFRQIVQGLKIEPATTAEINSTVKDVYKLLRQKGTSRVILIDKKGKLAGIITRRDIEEALMKPTNKHKFSSRKGRFSDSSFGQEPVTRFDSPVIKFYTKNVFSALKDSSIEKTLQNMINSDKNSVVLIDKNDFPYGIISNRTILKSITKLKQKKEIPIIFRKPTEYATNYEIDKILGLLRKFGEKMDKILPVKQIRINFKKSRNPKGGIILFDISLQLEFFSGKIFFAEVKNREAEMGIREAIKRIEKQKRREER